MPLPVSRNLRRRARRLRLRVPSVAPATTTEATVKGARLRTVPTSTNVTPIEFIFPFAPIEITYNQLSAEWASIDRPLNTPLIDLKGYNLMRVELRFLLAVPFDGIRISIDNDIRTLRSIATSQDPVAFINMDRMLTNPFNISRIGPSRTNQGFFFRIADMSVQSMRRNAANEITSAEVTMTLQETANPPIRKIHFDKINYSLPRLRGRLRPSSTVTKTTRPTAKNPESASSIGTALSYTNRKPFISADRAEAQARVNALRARTVPASAAPVRRL